MRRRLVLIGVVLLSLGGYYALDIKVLQEIPTSVFIPQSDLDEGGPEPIPHLLSIEALRQGEYPGSEITIEQTLSSASNGVFPKIS